MSIVNGSIDRRRKVLAGCNLTENPFTRAEPPEAVLDRVFVGRHDELVDAAMTVVDRPRNLLVYGGFGYGKTTFVRKLLRELHSARETRFLTGYAPLRHDSPQGFQIAALSAFATGALATEAAGPLFEFATQLQREVSQLGPEDSATRAPDLRMREGLTLAREAGYHRVVLAIDEVDKRDAEVVRSVLMGSRYFLDLDASFVLTGRFLDVFADPTSSLLAAFDHRIELTLFTTEDAREILRRNLSIARLAPEDPATFLPFEEATVQEIVTRARGLPRPLNLMAADALELAIREAVMHKVGACAVTTDHLTRALKEEGNLIYNDVSAEARTVLAQIFRRTGYVSGADLDALSPRGGVPEALRGLEALTRKDAVLRLESPVEGAVFALSPPMELKFDELQKRRDQLKALWVEAVNATTTSQKGKTLEAFAAAFFGETFTVVKSNLRTDTEEFDLVLERSRETDPRFQEGQYLFVECKNWRGDKVDQTVVTKVAGELGMHHMKQGFILTTGAFTEDAKQQANYAAAAMRVEIVLLEGAVIDGFLNDVRPVRDLLVELHRRQVLRQR